MSARGDRTNLAGTLTTNLAPDGTLWIPESLPHPDVPKEAAAWSLSKLGARMLAPFFRGSPWEKELAAITEEAFTFPTPTVKLNSTLSVLELFHGPTLAFKDIGARFLAALHRRIPASKEKLVLVATSGDTGGAVAAAFHKQAGTRVVILFPGGKISARQEKQLTAWGDNVFAFAVRGNFDDCQRLAKTALKDEALAARFQLVSANSISLGRILPQAVYYASSSLKAAAETGRTASYVIPTGNLGNAVAAFWARRMGFPLGKIALATNENRTLENLWTTGEYLPQPTRETLANAMDVGAPSNWERLSAFSKRAGLKAEVAAIVAVPDAAIREEIRATFLETGYVACPHTATALRVARRQGGEWIAVGTASPVKFETIVEPLIGKRLTVPPSLQQLLDKPSRAITIPADAGLLVAELLK